MSYGVRKLLIAAGILLTILPFEALASTFSGTLSFTGGAQINATSISFACSLAYTPSCPTGYGNFSSPSAAIQTGDFVAYGDQFGLIANLDQTGEPGNTSFLLPNFLIFNASATLPSPDLALDLTFIAPGVYDQTNCSAAPAPGQTCTLELPGLVTAANPDGLTWFNLSNSAMGSTLSFSVGGVARTISTGETAPFVGTFTAQFNVPYQDLLTALENDPLPASFAASVTTDTAPEPSSLFMAGVGIVLCVGIRRKASATRSAE
jgi:hypothetical protein